MGRETELGFDGIRKDIADIVSSEVKEGFAQGTKKGVEQGVQSLNKNMNKAANQTGQSMRKFAGLLNKYGNDINKAILAISRNFPELESATKALSQLFGDDNDFTKSSKQIDKQMESFVKDLNNYMKEIKKTANSISNTTKDNLNYSLKNLIHGSTPDVKDVEKSTNEIISALEKQNVKITNALKDQLKERQKAVLAYQKKAEMISYNVGNAFSNETSLKKMDKFYKLGVYIDKIENEIANELSKNSKIEIPFEFTFTTESLKDLKNQVIRYANNITSDDSIKKIFAEQIDPLIELKAKLSEKIKNNDSSGVIELTQGLVKTEKAVDNVGKAIQNATKDAQEFKKALNNAEQTIKRLNSGEFTSAKGASKAKLIMKLAYDEKNGEKHNDKAMEYAKQLMEQDVTLKELYNNVLSGKAIPISNPVVVEKEELNALKEKAEVTEKLAGAQEKLNKAKSEEPKTTTSSSTPTALPTDKVKQIKEEIVRLENDIKSDAGTGLLQSILFGEDGHIKMPSTILKEIEDIEKEIYAKLDKNIFADISDLMDSKYKLICASYLEGLLSLDEINSVNQTKVWRDDIFDEINRLGLSNIAGQYEYIDETTGNLSDLIEKVKELDRLQINTSTPSSSTPTEIDNQQQLQKELEESIKMVEGLERSLNAVVNGTNENSSSGFLKAQIESLKAFEEHLVSIEEKVKSLNLDDSLKSGVLGNITELKSNFATNIETLTDWMNKAIETSTPTIHLNKMKNPDWVGWVGTEEEKQAIAETIGLLNKYRATQEIISQEEEKNTNESIARIAELKKYQESLLVQVAKTYGTWRADSTIDMEQFHLGKENGEIWWREIYLAGKDGKVFENYAYNAELIKDQLMEIQRIATTPIEPIPEEVQKSELSFVDELAYEIQQLSNRYKMLEYYSTGAGKNNEDADFWIRETKEDIEFILDKYPQVSSILDEIKSKQLIGYDVAAKLSEADSYELANKLISTPTLPLTEEADHVEELIGDYKKLLELKYQIKNVDKSFYTGEHKYDWIGIYQSQEEAIAKDLEDKKIKLHSSLNLILNEDKNALGALEEEANKLKTSLQPVQDMVNRISSNSSISYLDQNKGSEDWYKGHAEAYKAIDDRLKELHNQYSLTNEELEEYITLQVKADKILEKQIDISGGVKGSGAKNKYELIQWIEKSFARDLGLDPNDIYSGLFGNITDAWYEGNGGISLFNAEGTKRNLREVSAEILKYKSDITVLDGALAANEDAEKLREINVVLNYIKKNAKEIESADFSSQIKKESEYVDYFSKKLSEGKHTDYYSKALEDSQKKLQELVALQERLNNHTQGKFPDAESIIQANEQIIASNEEVIASEEKKHKYTIASRENVPVLKAGQSIPEIEQLTQGVQELTQAEIEAAQKAKEIGLAFGITNKNALNEIQDVLLEYNKGSNSTLQTDDNGFLIASSFEDEFDLFAKTSVGFEDVLDTISKHIKSSKNEIDGYVESWKEVRKYVSSSKIAISEGVKSEFGDDFNRMRATIGMNVLKTDGSGSDIIEFLTGMNSVLKTTFDLTQGNQDAFRQLYDFLKIKPSKVDFSTLPESIRETVNQILDGTYTQVSQNKKYSSPKVKSVKKRTIETNQQEGAKVVEDANGRIIESNKKVVQSEDEKWDKITHIYDNYDSETKLETKQRTDKLPTDYRTTVEMWGRNKDDEWELQTVKIVKDMAKLSKEAESTETKINKAKVALKNFMAAFDNKTLGQGKQLIGYSDLETFDIKTLSDIDEATNKMKQLDAEYNKVVQDFRKGTSSMNPFVNAINNTSRMSTAIHSLYLDYQNLKVQSDEIGESLADIDIKFQDLMGTSNIYDRAKIFGELKVSINEVTDAIKIQRKEEALSAKQKREAIRELALYEDKNSRINALISLENQLSKSHKLTDEVKVKLDALFDSLTKVSDSGDLTVWNKQLKNFKDSIKDLPQIFEEKWNETLTKINAKQGISVDKVIGTNNIKKTIEKNVGINRTSATSHFKDSYKGTEWTGALADEPRKIIAQYDEIIRKMQEVETLRRTLRNYLNDQEKNPNLNYNEYIDETRDKISALIGELKQIDFKSFFNDQNIEILGQDRVDKFTQTLSDMELAQDKINADESFRKQKVALDDLNKSAKNLVSSYSQMASATNNGANSYSFVNAFQNAQAAQEAYDAAINTARTANVSQQDITNIGLDVDTKIQEIAAKKGAEAFDIFAKKIETAKEKLLNLGQLTPEAVAEFDKLKAKIDNIDLFKDLSSTEGANKFISDIAKIAPQVEQQIQEIMNSSRIGTFETQIAELDQLSVKSTRFTSLLGEVKQRLKEFNDFKEKTSDKQLISEKEVQLIRQLSPMINELYKQAQGKGNLVPESMGKVTDITSLNEAMVNYAKSLGFTKQVGKVVEKDNGTLAMSFSNEKNEVLKLTGSIDEVNRALRQTSTISKGTVGFITNLKASFKQMIGYFTRYYTGYMMMTRAISAFRKGIEIVKEFDAAMTELHKVSNDTMEALERFEMQSFDIAETIGSTGKEIVNSAAAWEKLGYAIEDASELAKNSALYSNVGDMDIDTATEHMVSTLKAYKEFDAQSSQLIVDKFNEIGNNYAITSEGIGSALERAAATLVAANNDLDQSIALITAGNIITQDPESVGNAIKVVSMRLRGAKTELEEAGEETDGLVESTSKLQDKIMALTGVDIMIDDSTFKSTYEILLEISKVWDDLSDVNRASLLEVIAGKTRGSVVAGLIQQGDTLESAYQDSQGAEGSALKENERYLESIQGHLDKLSNQWQKIWVSDLTRETMNWFIDKITGLLKIVEKIGIVWTTVITAGIITAGKALVKTYASGGRVKQRYLEILNNFIKSTLTNMPPNKLTER